MLVNGQLSKVGQYEKYKKLFEGKSEEVFQFDGNAKFKITTLLLQKASLFLSDMVMKEEPVFIPNTDNPKNVEFLKLLADNIDLETNGKALVSELSWRGAALRKGRFIDKDDIPQPTIAPADPAILYPIIHPDDNSKMIGAELRFYIEVNGLRYLRKEIYKIDRETQSVHIVQELWSLDAGDKPQEPLDIEEFYATHWGAEIDADFDTTIQDLLIEYIPNFKASELDFEGISDYEGVLNLIMAYEYFNTGAYKTIHNNLDPLKIIPNIWQQKDEHGNHIFNESKRILFSQPFAQSQSGLLVPHYVKNEVDTNTMEVLNDFLERNIVLSLEINPAALGFTKDGFNAESGKAKDYKLIAPRNNAHRKRTNIQKAYINLAYNLMKVAKNTWPYWKDLELVKPDMEFSTGTQEWDETVETVSKMTGVLSNAEQIRQIYPNWTEDKIQQVILEKKNEQGQGFDDTAFKSLASIGGSE